MTRKINGGSQPSDFYLQGTDLPFNSGTTPEKIMSFQIDLYDGNRDPGDHLETYRAHMAL
jgi:hypothetical protein